MYTSYKRIEKITFGMLSPKMIKKMAEDSKVAVRGARREAIEKFKKAQKAKEISEDELARLEQSTQKMTDSHTARIDEILAVKEREILTV